MTALEERQLKSACRYPHLYDSLHLTPFHNRQFFQPGLSVVIYNSYKHFCTETWSDDTLLFVISNHSGASDNQKDKMLYLYLSSAFAAPLWYKIQIKLEEWKEFSCPSVIRKTKMFQGEMDVHTYSTIYRASGSSRAHRPESQTQLKKKLQRFNISFIHSIWISAQTYWLKKLNSFHFLHSFTSQHCCWMAILDQSK